MGDVTVIARTQRIIVNPDSRSVSVINAGPVGPTGPIGPSEAASILTTDDDILTRDAGVLARISRADLANDPNFRTVINHGSTAGTPRAGDHPILWVGTVDPTYSDNNDQWYVPGTTALYVKIAGVWEEQGSARFAPIGLGVKGLQTSTTNFVTSPTHTVYQDEGLTLTVDETNGRRLKITATVNPYCPGGVQDVVYALVRNGTLVHDYYILGGELSTTISASQTLVHIHTPSSTTAGVVWKLQIKARSSGLSVSSYADATTKKQFLIEDIG